MIRTMGRMLLVSAVALVMVHGRAGAAPAPADEESSMGRILEFQKKLNERIDYSLLVQTTLDKALDELLGHEHIPWTDNKAAFVGAQQDPQLIYKTEINRIGPFTAVTAQPC